MPHKIALFKYKSLRTHAELKHLDDALAQKIWMPPLSDLNDPFEGCFKLEPLTFEFICKNNGIYERLFNYCQCKKPDITKEEFEIDLNNTLKSGDKAQLFKLFFPDHGVFSFTACPSNIPMWDHYGNDHQGYCLIFELDFSLFTSKLGLTQNQALDYYKHFNMGEIIVPYDLPEEPDRQYILSKIGYSEQPPILSLIKLFELISEKNEYAAFEYFFKHSFGVKFYQWSYENEYRLITNSNSKRSGLMLLNMYVPFLKIVGVIMGEKLECKNIFPALCCEHKVDLFIARSSDDDYKINLTKIIDFNKVEKSLKSICKCGCIENFSNAIPNLDLINV